MKLSTTLLVAATTLAAYVSADMIQVRRVQRTKSKISRRINFFVFFTYNGHV